MVRVKAAIPTTTREQGGCAHWRGGACHPLRTIPLVKRGGKKKTKEEEEGMGDSSSGAESRLVRIVVAA